MRNNAEVTGIVGGILAGLLLMSLYISGGFYKITLEGILATSLLGLITGLFIGIAFLVGLNVGYRKGAIAYERHLPKEERERHDHYVGY